MKTLISAKTAAFILFASLCVAVPAFCEKAPVLPLSAGEVIPLWPEDKLPGTGSSLPDEPAPGLDRRKVVGIKSVSNPDITFYQATSGGSLPAVVVCPGGGYGHLAYQKEGTEIAAWLNSIGVNALVLKYRVPQNRDGALMDMERAVRLTRQNARAWGIDAGRVGVLGFSAGGHLGARLSASFDQTIYPPVDAADRLSCRPDFVILVYPAYLNKGTAVAPELAVTSRTPPTLVVHNEMDAGYVTGSKIYAEALKAGGVVTEFQLYKEGGHGHGLRSDKDVKAWPDACAAWLKKIGVLKPSDLGAGNDGNVK